MRVCLLFKIPYHTDSYGNDRISSLKAENVLPLGPSDVYEFVSTEVMYYL